MARLVSILVPAYNAAPWISDAIESALAQTWPAIEVIVVDDGSSDETTSCASQHVSSRVRLIRQKRSGASAARNRAILEARGEFLQFLDADDLLSPEKIESQMFLLQHGVGGFVAACEWGRFFDRPADACFRPEPVWADLDPVSWLVRSWLGGGMMHPATWLVPKSVADRAGLWDERLSLNDDQEYFTRVLLASCGVKFSWGARTLYRSGLPLSLSRLRSDSAWESALLSLELSVAALLSQEDSERTRGASATLYQRFVYEVFGHRADLARRAADSAAKLGGSTLSASGGPMFRALSRVLGWRTATRARNVAYRFGYKRLAATWSARD